MNLEGDYVGWAVNDVQERQVTLKSLDGSELSLELQVNDQMIKEPPKPVPAPTQQADDQPGGDQADGDQAPLSRAEEIRRRIEERREQLKQEAEASDDASDDASAEKKNRYQEAIRAMLMKRASEKKDDADGSQN